MVLRLTCLASAMVALTAGATATAQAPPPTTSAPTADPAAAPSEDVMMKADVITEDRDGKVWTAEGNVEVRMGQRTLRADRLIYDQNKETIRAQGHVEITDAETGGIEFADEIEGDEQFNNGFATRFSARMVGNALLSASSAIRSDGTRNALEQVVYSNCQVCEANGEVPTWQLRARRAVQNTETQMITYQDAVLEIKGVPVIYLPWFAHPDPTSERRSGFIMAQKPLGISSKYGPFYEQPYYWAISPSQDLTIAPLITGEVNPLIKVDYRKKFFSGYVDLKGSVTYEKEFNSDGDKIGDLTWRSNLYGSGRFDINKQWQWGFGIERQTDDLYDRRYDIKGEDDLRGLIASQPRQLLTQLFTTGQDSDFYLEAGAFLIQGLRATDDDATIPKVAPTFFAEKVFDLGSNGEVAASVSAVGLFRDAQTTLPNGDLAMDTARVTARAKWESQYIFGPGLVLKPYGEARQDYYRVDSGSAAGEQDIVRGLGVAGAELSYPFIRRGKNVDVLIEPIVMVAYGTKDANNDGIPNEDSLLFEADESNIFQPNPIPTYDLWEGGGKAAAGMRATVNVGKDTRLLAQVGRRWREDPDPTFSAGSNLSGEKSDYVASVRADLAKIISIGTRLRMNDDYKVNRIDLDANANFWRVSGGARYFRIDGGDAGLLWNGGFKISDRWSFNIDQARNLRTQEDIRFSAGFAYTDECSYFALVYQREGGRDRTLGPSESIQFRFVLTGLGGVTPDSFD